MSAAATAIVVAGVGALITFATTFVLKLRDEARIGGAAERRLRAQFQYAADVLAESDGKPNAAWVDPGIEVTAWSDHWDQYAARLSPEAWDCVNDAAELLRNLVLSAGSAPKRSTDDWSHHPSAVAVEDTRAAVADAMHVLDRREARWLALRPWFRIPPRLGHRTWLTRTRTGVATAFVILVVGAGVGLAGFAHHSITAPVTTGEVVSELRDLNPDAKVINCQPAGGDERWRCDMVAGTCQIASTTPVGCGSQLRLDLLDVRADRAGNCIYERVIRRRRAGGSPASSTSLVKDFVGAVGCLGRDDPPADAG